MHFNALFEMAYAPKCKVDFSIQDFLKTDNFFQV